MTFSLSEKYDEFFNPYSDDEKQMALRVGEFLLEPEVMRWQIFISERDKIMRQKTAEKVQERKIVDEDKKDAEEFYAETHTKAYDATMQYPFDDKKTYFEEKIFPIWHAIHKTHSDQWPELTEKEEQQIKVEYNIKDNSSETWPLFFAQKANRKVLAHALGLPYYVTPDMYDSYLSMYVMCGNEKNGVVYYWAQDAVIFDHGAKMKKLMDNDQFNVSGHEQEWQEIQTNDAENAKTVERLGKMMQAEMTYFGKPLEGIMINRAKYFDISVWGELRRKKTSLNEAHRRQWRVWQLLAEFWKYGNDLEKIFNDAHFYIHPKSLNVTSPRDQKVGEAATDRNVPENCSN